MSDSSNQPITHSASRDMALDVTKGIAIVAVVLFHMTRGFTDSGQIVPSIPLKFADTVAYSFHIQIFLVIAGYLAWPKSASLQSQISRQASLYYTYLLWSIVSWFIAAAMSNLVNHPVSYSELLFIPVVPILHFWFLLPLMGGLALLGVLRRPVALAIACLLIILVMSMPGLLELGIYHWIFYVLFGGLLRALGVRPKASLAAGLLATAILFAGAWNMVQDGPGARLAVVLTLVRLSGCYAAYVAGTYLARAKRVGSLLSLLGQHSMSIYLLHVIVGSGLRIILVKLAPHMNVPFAVAFTTISAIGGPLVFEMVAERLGLASWLGFAPFRFARTRASLAASTAT